VVSVLDFCSKFDSHWLIIVLLRDKNKQKEAAKGTFYKNREPENLVVSNTYLTSSNT